MNTQTFNISMPKELVEKIDSVAKSRYKSRSDYLRELVVKDLDKIAIDQDINQIMDRGQLLGKKLGIKSEQDVNDIIEGYKTLDDLTR